MNKATREVILMIVQCDKEQKKLCLVIRDCPHREEHERMAYQHAPSGYGKFCTNWGECWLGNCKIRCTKVREVNND